MKRRLSGVFRRLCFRRPLVNKTPVIFLLGPTASGKTELAVELVRRLPLEIISVDSALVYRGLDIGTGKPKPDILAKAPHRLIDIRDPAQAYSVAEFINDARRAITGIENNGRIPLLVGGTGLYFRALCDGLAPMPNANPAVRARLAGEAEKWGWSALHRRLAQVDPQAAARIHPNDPQRIQRALEVYELTNRPMTALLSSHSGDTLDHPVIRLILEPTDRLALQERIAARFHEMLKSGLVAEVQRLRARGNLHRDLPSMRAVGYRQVWNYLMGQVNYPDMVATAIAATRQLARRQLTWLRSETGEAARFSCQDTGISDKILHYLSKNTLWKGNVRGVTMP
uniref:tRNA dimethylallyltransferase n=1 Tax=Candidatus Kentrum sp. MB TaxID=2138164 RepID=A0A451BBR1_9GAMM|nr:MAG: tRNA dimethylallyltransferase [Candidatus Kentron sp. MB]VFK30924.1 MAG: tRNA dimethylallyltransferase [Candidatus Kentron sp. MB]VFK75737.1 MAG: tRNA dimethylallyltransferase [Candidatus Kentron sp. MB]